jgi:outer membrane protein assembly factor BamB
MPTALLVPLLLAPAHLAPFHVSDVEDARVDDVGATTWTQWRGPNRDGVVGGPDWPATLTEENVKETWSVDGLGESYCSPIVSERFVFTVSTVDKKEEVAQAYDRRTGEKVWETRWEGSMTVPFFAAKNGSWIRSTPIYDGEALYVGGIRDVLVCLEAEDGSVRWRLDFMEEFGTELPSFGMVCSPLIVGDSLYVQAGQSIARIDRSTGEALWRSTAGANGGGRGGMDSAFSSPILATVAGKDQLVVQSRTHLAGIDPEDGAELWSTPVQAFRGMNILTPQVIGDDAIFTSAYGGRAHLYAVEKGDEGYSVSEAWTGRAQGYMTSPVVVGGHAYLFLRSNRFTCVDLSDGSEGWTSGPSGDEYWSLVAQGERILALANTGILRLIDANPAEYSVVGEVQLVEGPSWAHVAVTAPVEGEGTEIFVRGQTSLHAFRWK